MRSLFKTFYFNRIFIPTGFTKAVGVIFLPFILLVLSASCNKDDPEPGNQRDNRDPMALLEDHGGTSYNGAPPQHSKINVFNPELLYPGFAFFRSPALIATDHGTLIALCQMRTGDDNAPKTLVYRRSTDNGETWGELTLMEELTTEKVYGNTVFIADRLTGKIHLVYLESFPDEGRPIPCNMYHRVSSDDGLTWSERMLIPNIVNATWRPPGPGTGIQLKRGEHAGRLFIPGRYPNGNYGIYSDDGGETWNLGYKSVISSEVGPENEATCVELSELHGTQSVIYINSRNERSTSTDVHRRLEAYSDDSGESLRTGFLRNPYIKTDRCQAALLRWAATDMGEERNRILFSTVSWAKEIGTGTAQNRRRHVGIWSSFDETESWTPVAKRIQDLKGGYSSMAKTADHNIGILFEEGETSYFGEISFVKINEAFLDVPLIGAKWDFEEQVPANNISEGTTIQDSYNGGTHRPVEVVGNLSVINGSELFQQKAALAFDGKSYLKLPDEDTWTQFDFNEYSSFTVEIVIKVRSTGSTGLLIGRPYKAQWPQWFMQLEEDGTVSFRIDDDEDYAFVKTKSLVADNRWHHIAAVRDRSTKKLKIYVDGQLSNEVDDSLKGSLANRRPLYIGGKDGSDTNFIGEIDFIRISPVAIDEFFAVARGL